MKFADRFLILVVLVVVLSLVLTTEADAATSANSSVVKSPKSRTTNDNDIRLNIFLPGVQMRYQDTAAQSQELITHYTYTVSGQINNLFLLGFEYLTVLENTGNQSFAIERKFTEQNVFMGFTAAKKDFLVSGQYLMEFMLTPQLILGQSSNRITTLLLGGSQAIDSGTEMTYGIGLIGSARLGYLLVETDFRYQTSKNYEPGSLMMGSVRIGANLGF